MVAILGDVGDNFGAGMSGGMAFVYDEDGAFTDRVNPDSIVWQRLASRHWEDELKALKQEHAKRRESTCATRLLANWDAARGKFWQICPKEMLQRLSFPLRDMNRTSDVA